MAWPQRRTFYRLALFLYTVSLVLPIDGKWFSGLLMVLASCLGAMWSLGALLGTHGWLQSLQGALLILLPFSNVLIVHGLLALRRNGQPAQTWFKWLMLLAACTAAYAVWGFMHSVDHLVASRERETFRLFCTWSAALISLTVAAWLA